MGRDGNVLLEIYSERTRFYFCFKLRNNGSYLSKRPSWVTSFRRANILSSLFLGKVCGFYRVCTLAKMILYLWVYLVPWVVTSIIDTIYILWQKIELVHIIRLKINYTLTRMISVVVAFVIASLIRNEYNARFW